MAIQTNTIQEAVHALLRGDPVIFPTETVYGLGVAVSAAESPQVLYDLKQRDQGKPIAWLIAEVDDLDRYGRVVPDFARALARTFWPGPLTLIVKAGSRVPPSFRTKDGTIGLRMPNNDVALALVRAAGTPVATTSANVAGFKAPRSFSALDAALASRVGVVVADLCDDEKSGVASTIIDCTKGHPIMVREGAISIADIQALS